jgi:UDP-N-acetylmuramoyl-L-alanyl-D-glutamate--2,6-diaminopimelate ligase
MKLLKDLIYKAGIEEVVGPTNIAISAVSFDSREVRKDGLFVAVRGTLSDGHKFIDKAVEGGVIAIVCETIPEVTHEEVTYVRVRDSARALGLIASTFYDHPSEKLQLVGITGTNGKTTTATLGYRLFQALGYKAGLISTVEVRIHKEEIPATHTTPDPLRLNQYLSMMIEKGVKVVFMEVSSHALVQERTAGLQFDLAAFTNITHDHLDYHGSFDNYILAKKKFFDELGPKSFALVNKDDRHGLTMLHHTKGQKRTYALKNDADFKARILDNSFDGLQLQVDGHEVYSKLIGSFNAYNLLAVYSMACLLGEDPFNVLTAISALSSARGRFEYITSADQLTAVVDYAHTPDALKNVLTTLRDITKSDQRLITVVGCGGDRDVEKRPVMAALAAQFSDKVILTSDNPRSEDPQHIIDDMRTGLSTEDISRTLSIVDRKEAIRTAVHLGASGDVILVAGKGHETYQEIKGERFPFNDMEILKESFNQAT